MHVNLKTKLLIIMMIPQILNRKRLTKVSLSICQILQISNNLHIRAITKAPYIPTSTQKWNSADVSTRAFIQDVSRISFQSWSWFHYFCKSQIMRTPQAIFKTQVALILDQVVIWRMWLIKVSETGSACSIIPSVGALSCLPNKCTDKTLSLSEMAADYLKKTVCSHSSGKI